MLREKTKSVLHKVRRGLCACGRKIEWLFEAHPAIFTAALAILLVLVTETLGRRSLADALRFAVKTPVRFAVNASIVALTLSLSFLFPKRTFVFGFFTLLWLALGIVNCVVLGNRVTPFGFIDIELLGSVISIIRIYLNVFEIVLACLAIAAAIAGLVVLYIKAPKVRVRFKAAVLHVLLFGLCTGATYAATSTADAALERSESFSNIAQAYRDYGFVYCFSIGMVDRGVNRPEEYTQAAADSLVQTLEEGAKTEEPAVKPDIIVVQLESFFDVGYVKGLTVAENPVPVYTALKEQYSNGFLTVPSFGAGTANTEFEVLSGISLDLFGIGEYPYKTVLYDENACESMPVNLRALGYKSHAIHNNTGTFYRRNTVYGSLGFDTFTPIECMGNVSYNQLEWCLDAPLTDEILRALDSTEEQDFVFTVTVQTHGKYDLGADPLLTESLGVEWPGHESEVDSMAYFISQLRETDAFVGELVKALEERGKPAVLVLYGDHLPTFRIGAQDLENGSEFETEYIIWDNIGLEKEDKDLAAYQLCAEVQDRLGMDEGLVTKLHQQLRDDVNYDADLQFLAYDMLYGSAYCWDGVHFVPTALQIGSTPVTITDVEWADGVLTIYGENFTNWSVAALNGSNLDTVLVSDTCLTVELDRPPVGTLTVRQEKESHKVLAESEPFLLPTEE